MRLHPTDVDARLERRQAIRKARVLLVRDHALLDLGFEFRQPFECIDQPLRRTDGTDRIQARQVSSTSVCTRNHNECAASTKQGSPNRPAVTRFTAFADQHAVAVRRSLGIAEVRRTAERVVVGKVRVEQRIVNAGTVVCCALWTMTIGVACASSAAMLRRWNRGSDQWPPNVADIGSPEAALGEIKHFGSEPGYEYAVVGHGAVTHVADDSGVRVRWAEDRAMAEPRAKFDAAARRSRRMRKGTGELAAASRPRRPGSPPRVQYHRP